MKNPFSKVAQKLADTASDTLAQLRSGVSHLAQDAAAVSHDGLEAARVRISDAFDAAHDFAVRNAPEMTDSAERLAARVAEAHKKHGHIIEGAAAGAATGLKISILFPPAAPVLMKGGAVVGAIVGGIAGPEIAKRAEKLMDKYPSQPAAPSADAPPPQGHTP